MPIPLHVSFSMSHVRQRRLDHLPWIIRLLGRPVLETGAELPAAAQSPEGNRAPGRTLARLNLPFGADGRKTGDLRLLAGTTNVSGTALSRIGMPRSSFITWFKALNAKKIANYGAFGCCPRWSCLASLAP